MKNLITPFKQGGSVCVRLTGYVDEEKHYTVEKKGKQIILTEVEIREAK